MSHELLIITIIPIVEEVLEEEEESDLEEEEGGGGGGGGECCEDYEASSNCLAATTCLCTFISFLFAFAVINGGVHLFVTNNSGSTDLETMGYPHVRLANTASLQLGLSGVWWFTDLEGVPSDYLIGQMESRTLDSALSDFDGAYDDAKSGMTKSLVLLGASMACLLGYFIMTGVKKQPSQGMFWLSALVLTVATYFTYGAISSINVGGNEMDLACIGGSASWDNPLQFAAFCQDSYYLNPDSMTVSGRDIPGNDQAKGFHSVMVISCIVSSICACLGSCFASEANNRRRQAEEAAANAPPEEESSDAAAGTSDSSNPEANLPESPAIITVDNVNAPAPIPPVASAPPKMEDDLPDYNALDSMASPSSQYGDTSSEYGMSSPGPAPGPSAPAFDSADGDELPGYDEIYTK